MLDQSLLCKCTFCLDENVNDVLLNRNTYNRYCLRIQEYSVRDENLEYMDLQTEENMNLHAKENMSSYAEENMNLHAEENMNLQEDNLNLVNENSDTESFNFNEEDNEYYFDYNNDDDDDDNDDNDDDNAMCVDDKTNIPIEELKLLHLKSLYNFTESAYDNIMKIFTTNNISLYKAKKYLKETTGLILTFYDMCENSCICYTGQYKSYQN